MTQNPVVLSTLHRAPIRYRPKRLATRASAILHQEPVDAALRVHRPRGRKPRHSSPDRGLRLDPLLLPDGHSVHAPAIAARARTTRQEGRRPTRSGLNAKGAVVQGPANVASHHDMA